jgi:hypothetical protein
MDTTDVPAGEVPLVSEDFDAGLPECTVDHPYTSEQPVPRLSDTDVIQDDILVSTWLEVKLVVRFVLVW